MILAAIMESFRLVTGIDCAEPLQATYLAASVFALAGALYLMSSTHKQQMAVAPLAGC